MRILFGLTLSLLLVATGCSKSDQPKQMENEQSGMSTEMSHGWTLADVGFKTPESVYHDAVDDVYYVSNIGGPQPLEKDDNGFISKVSPDGKVIELEWISGDEDGIELNAPKGLARYNDLLLVTDIDVLRAFDIKTGEPKWSADLPEATFANDVWAAKDVIYVTDTGTEGPGAVYSVTVKGHENVPEVKTIVRDPALNNPNGVLAFDDQIWMVPYKGSDVFQINKDGSFETIATAPEGSLDGIVRLNDGRIAFTSWDGQTVYVMNQDRSVEPLFTGLESPADIGYDSKRDLLLIPLFMKDTVIAKPVSEAMKDEGSSDEEMDY